MNKKKVALLFGGKSAEREISIKSALYIAAYLDRNLFDLFIIYINQNNTIATTEESLREIFSIIHSKKYALFGSEDTIPDDFENYIEQQIIKSSHINSVDKLTVNEIDIAFPVFHGLCGEDAIIQGVLEFNCVPYTGCGVTASLIANDKEKVKKIAKSSQIQVTQFLTLHKDLYISNFDTFISKITETIKFPVFVKPPNLGSSVGISKCYNIDELKAGIRLAFNYGDRVIVEKEIIGKEYGICVTGDLIPEFSVPAEFNSVNDFLDYEAKYGGNALPDIIPANIDQITRDKLYASATVVYREFELSGLSRLDFFIDNNSSILLNEINTVPGFGAMSVYNNAWRKSGVTVTNILTKIVNFGFERYARKQKIQYNSI